MKNNSYNVTLCNNICSFEIRHFIFMTNERVNKVWQRWNPSLPSAPTSKSKKAVLLGCNVDSPVTGVKSSWEAMMSWHFTSEMNHQIWHISDIQRIPIELQIPNIIDIWFKLNSHKYKYLSTRKMQYIALALAPPRLVSPWCCWHRQGQHSPHPRSGWGQPGDLLKEALASQRITEHYYHHDYHHHHQCPSSPPAALTLPNHTETIKRAEYREDIFHLKHLKHQKPVLAGFLATR